MLSFTPVTEENVKDILEKALNTMPDGDEGYLEEIIYSLVSDDGCEYAVSFSHGCVAIRVFDEGYSFIYPAEVCDGADALSLVNEIREYSVKEEIPLVFTDVPSDALGYLLPQFRHANVDAADSMGECYTVRILSEISSLDFIPTIEVDDEIVLTPMSCEDDEIYAAICRDKETNAFWGYDDLADCTSDEDSYFREVAEGEFSRGVAISFAIRYKGSFVGEATLYRFNLLGDCQSALRILPEMRRLGIASRALSAIINFGEKIGLTSVSATVMAKNEPSIALCKKCFASFADTSDELCTFTRVFDN